MSAVIRLLQLQREFDRWTQLAAGGKDLQATQRLSELAPLLHAARRDAQPELRQKQEFTGKGGASHQDSAQSGTSNRGSSTGLPALKGLATNEVEVVVDLRMPCVATSLVRLFSVNRTPLVSVHVRNGGERPRRFCVSTRVEGFSAAALETVRCLPGEVQAVDQFPTFFTEAITRLDEFCVASLSVEVTDLESGAGILRRTIPVRLLARQTAVLYQLDPQSGAYVDLRHTLGAWITPNARSVLELLRTAANFSKLRAMSGYQVDEAGVLEHVRAIYEALKAAEIVYVNSVDAFGGVDGQFLQRVRTPSESLACKSANCIDGTVLMASLLEATGIEAGIVFVPGHAYLSWLKRKPATRDRLPPELEHPTSHLDMWEYIETTLIGGGSFEQAREHARVATSKFVDTDLLELVSVAQIRQANVTPME